MSNGQNMAGNDSIVPLQTILPMQIDAVRTTRKYIAIMLKENIPVLCVNLSINKKRTMPFKALYENNNKFWQQEGSWNYYLSKDDYTNVREKAVTKPESRTYEITAAEQQTDKAKALTVDQGYGKEAETILSMTGAEKAIKLEEDKQLLNGLITKKIKDPKIVTYALVNTTKDAALINHAALMDAIHLADDEAKQLTKNLVNSTGEIVKCSVQLISEDIFDDTLMKALVEKSNGTIIQHMTRVYLNGISFLAFYNRLFSTSSSAINKLRSSFADKYREFYRFLLPHIALDDISLERIFYRGMMAIPLDLFTRWAMGFLIHDIGKASAVEYHEGEDEYNRDIVVEHVKLGYTSVMNKTNYPREAGLITGYHHEYYGDNSGYGYFRAYLEQYKKANPNAKQDYCITYELEPILDFISMAYFPAKVLEIVDIYDSITDPNRKYHKAMSQEEALSMMREEFIAKRRKIDPVLFDIFESFTRRKQKRCLRCK